MNPWITILALAMAPAVSNGLARFAYALILPAMREDLGWTYTMAGWVNTANAIGYLLGAWLTLALSRRIAPANLFIWGMFTTGVSLLASGLTADLALLSVFRITAGIGGAAMFISGATLAAASWPDNPSRNALGMALYFAGGGIGMLATALLLPPLLAVGGAAAWPWAWIVTGCLGIAAWLGTLRIVAVAPAPNRNDDARHAPVPWRRLLPSLAGYFLFAVGYIIYLTFIIAWLRDNDGGLALVMTSWSLLGIGVMGSAFLWRGMLERHHGGVPLGAACLASAVSAALPLFASGPVGICISALCFGASFFIGPAAVTAISKHNLPASQWAPGIALFTLIFAIGQTLGPIGAGWISDLSGSLDAGLLAGALILAGGGVAGLLQKPLSG